METLEMGLRLFYREPRCQPLAYDTKLWLGTYINDILLDSEPYNDTIPEDMQLMATRYGRKTLFPRNVVRPE